jgi:PAS domain S-box-containing protein
VDNATYGIYWLSAEGNLLFVNPALVQMLGYDSARELMVLGTTQSIYVDPTAREGILSEYFKNERVETTVEWKRKDGKRIIVRINGRRAQDPVHGKDCIEIIVQDVTERMAIEKQLLEAQKFEAIGQLAGGIAHDFNNMIGAIMGWADIGSEETEPDSRLHRHFEKVRHQAQRAAVLTRQLLAFARRQILEARDIDLNQTVIETLSLLEKVIGSNIEIKANLAPDLAIVRADPTQVEQVLMNLCINARDAMPNGGALVIDSMNVTFDDKFCAARALARPGQYAMLAVSDTGTGMDEATLSRIFEPFFTTKEFGKGTGLGLATVYGIAQQHGGFVDVESRLGEGSTFRVYLPISTMPRLRREKAEDATRVEGGSETLLVAEDHDGLRHLAYEILTNLGYRVLLAGDGEKALEEFNSHSPDISLAILDVMLPKMSGTEVYARISATKPDLPVIFATGYSADMGMLRQAQDYGLPVLQKPYTARVLARKIREILDQQQIAARDLGLTKNRDL